MLCCIVGRARRVAAEYESLSRAPAPSSVRCRRATAHVSRAGAPSGALPQHAALALAELRERLDFARRERCAQSVQPHKVRRRRPVRFRGAPRRGVCARKRRAYADSETRRAAPRRARCCCRMRKSFSRRFWTWRKPESRCRSTSFTQYETAWMALSFSRLRIRRPTQPRLRSLRDHRGRRHWTKTRLLRLWSCPTCCGAAAVTKCALSPHV